MQSLHGVEWLIGMFRGLQGALTGPDGTVPTKPLDEDNRELACDLLGLAPEQRQGRLPIDPPLADGARPTDAEVAAFQAALVAAEIARLESYKNEDLAPRDEEDQISSAIGAGVGTDRTSRLIRRYLTAAKREMDLAYWQLCELISIPTRERQEENFRQAMAAFEARDKQAKPAAPQTKPQPKPQTAPAPKQAPPPPAAAAPPPPANGKVASPAAKKPAPDDRRAPSPLLRLMPVWDHLTGRTSARAACRGNPPSK
jgi:hypothetical protein